MGLPLLLTVTVILKWLLPDMGPEVASYNAGRRLGSEKSYNRCKSAPDQVSITDGRSRLDVTLEKVTVMVSPLLVWIVRVAPSEILKPAQSSHQIWFFSEPDPRSAYCADVT